MKKLAITLAILTAFSANTAHAASNQLFDNLVSFGDSLSDVGNVSGTPITTPGGSTWIYYLGQQLGFHVSASNAGGNDFAQAGAITGPNSAIPALPSNTPEIIQQINDYVAAHNGHVDSDALYTINAGANDIQYFLYNGGDPNNTPLLIENGTGNITNMVNALHQAGAQFIIVANVPDLGATPAVKMFGPVIASQISALSYAFNSDLLSRLNTTGANIIQLDTFNFTDALVANYQEFGFIGPANFYGDGSNANVNQYIFAHDAFHPSGETHLIFSQYAAEVITAPLYAAIMAHAPFAVMDSQNSMIRNQLSPLSYGYENIPVGKFASFAGGDYNTQHIDEDGQIQPGYKNDNKAFTVGGMYRFSENGLVGAAIGRSMGDVDYAHHAGGFKLDENLVTLFGAYNDQNFYGNAEVNYGNIDYSNIKRNFMLGILPETVYGETTGEQFAAGGLLGYNFTLPQRGLKTGPIATLDWQRVIVKPYAESSSHFANQTTNGGAFDALQYSKQDNDSLVGGLGWQINWQTTINNTAVVPYLQATYNHQFENQQQKVYAGVTTLPGSKFYIPVDMPNKDFGLINTGVQTVFNNGLLLSFNYSTLLGRSNQHAQNFMIDASVPI